MNVLRFYLAAIAFVVSVVGVGGCQSYPFTFQENQRVDARDYQVQVTTAGTTDILFIIDNSPTMAEAIENLRSNVSSFIDVLAASVNDYQVGIITPDAVRVPADDGTCDPCCDLDTDGDGLPDYSNCDGGRLTSFDGKTRILTRPSADADADTQAQQTQQLIDNFNATVTSLGTSGNAYERSFTTMRLALAQDEATSPVAVRALNYGFLRANADLAVIIMSDEDECSHDDASWFDEFDRDDSDCYIDSTATPTSEVVDFLVNLKGGDVRKVRAAAIVGAIESVSATLGYDAAGCYTDDTGAASNACGCYAKRYVPDQTTEVKGDDLFCNILAAAPYYQPNERIPAAANNQGGCEKLPGSRYIELLNDLQSRRAAVGEKEGVLLDSLCKADYRQTLIDIANNVVLDNCFTLVDTPSSEIDLSSAIIVYRNGEVLPQVEEESGEDGWSYRDPTETGGSPKICLEGSLVKSVNDQYEIAVVSGVTGFDD